MKKKEAVLYIGLFFIGIAYYIHLLIRRVPYYPFFKKGEEPYLATVTDTCMEGLIISFMAMVILGGLLINKLRKEVI